ncbi:alpha-tocopherol transfer protein-like [Saccoglossus kowalevskii]|uniref:Alpha-tocopherol transfer protein-like n=1 Tax=Saccoglossus kowalevskii TaxID=10224 RepID=A0ABM0GRJ6_SACKO|nr:PREDICTED: alpha-tocopherol transfer protein-like [Saccoglossus kowalevskii]
MAEPPVYDCKLSPKLLEKARKELNETAESRDAGIKRLWAMIRARPDIRCPTDAVFILAFLRARKFDVEKAFKLLEKWCSMRVDLDAVFENYRPSSIKEMIEAGSMVSLPTRDNEGRTINIHRPGKWDPKKFTIWEYLRYGLLTGDYLMWNEETQINGVVEIIDMEGFNINHMAQIGPRFAMSAASMMSADCLPLRMKSMNVINESGFFDAIFAMLKPFLKDKIKKRIHVHGDDLSKLHQVVPSSILPSEYGGSHSSSIEDIVSKYGDLILSKEDEYVAMMEYGIKKSDLVKKTVDDAATMTGTTGSYTKIEM